MSSGHDSLEWEDTAFDMASLSFISGLDQSKLKGVLVTNALQSHDLELLEHLGASKYGFAENDLRCRSWIELLSSRVEGTFQYGSLRKPHRDEHQVKLDVNRSFSYLKDEGSKRECRKALFEVIVTTLRKFPQLNYYQGYHEVVSIFVLVCDREALEKAVELFTLLYLRDFMMDTLQCTLEQLGVLSQFVTHRDPNLSNILQLDERRPLFAIASVLTILVHNFEYFEQDSPIFCVFDMIISTNSLSCVFVIYAELLVYFKDPILKQVKTSLLDFDSDMDMIHSVVQQTLLKLLTLDVWSEILINARLHLNSYKVEMKKYVNKYSSLLNEDCIESNALVEKLKKEIEWNRTRNTRIQTSIPPILKWSLAIGLIAVVIKVGSSHSTVHSSSLLDSLRRILHETM